MFGTNCGSVPRLQYLDQGGVLFSPLFNPAWETTIVGEWYYLVLDDGMAPMLLYARLPLWISGPIAWVIRLSVEIFYIARLLAPYYQFYKLKNCLLTGANLGFLHFALSHPCNTVSLYPWRNMRAGFASLL